MDAYIAINQSEGTLTFKCAGFPNVIIKKGAEYLFSTPQEFFAFRPKLDVLAQAKLLSVKTISNKEASKIATEAINKRRDDVRNDHITLSPQEQAFNDRKIVVSDTVSAPVVDATDASPVVDAAPAKATADEINAQIAELREEFKTSKNKMRKDVIRAKVKELQALL